ncbi:MAG: hypothetical protein MJ231_04420 [bacterium]|nr:hypothetical protein [bacterium]
MTYLILGLVGLLLLLSFSLVVAVKMNIKKSKNIEQLENAILQQRKIHEKFEQLDEESKKEKEKIDSSDVVSNVDNAMDILRNIKINRK